MASTCVIFDLDGTLLNTLEDLADAGNYTLEKFGLPTHETEKYKKFVGNGVKKLVRKMIPRELRRTEIEKEILEVFLDRYSTHYAIKTKPYDGIVELIDTLKSRGIKVGMVSNKSHHTATTIMNTFFRDQFDYVLGQSDKYPLKPNPMGAISAVENMGCTIADCVFVGDSGVDMETALEGGFYPIGVLWGFRDKKELMSRGAREVVSTVEELESIILREARN